MDPFVLTFCVLMVVVTIGMGFWAQRKSRTAHDFFVAGRSVSVGWNASAISGEYLSAASFMGVAGMVMSMGYDVLWYPVCYACGYLFLLLFIAGPLRRFGAYTIPDFAEGRFDSPLFRKIAVVFVLFIGFFYTMPQMKGAGVALGFIFRDVPYWGGVVVVGAVITFNVAMGGMKGITLVQAFQYWAKMFAISVPIFVLMSVHGGYGRQLGINRASENEPILVATTEIERPKQAPADSAWLNPFGKLTSKPAAKAGLNTEQQRPFALLYTYSLIIALVCGTAGLPHILVRFYTNPDGAAAKRTTFWVMILIGVFYLFPPIFGAMGRNILPELYAQSGYKGTDGVVLKLPMVLNARSGLLPWGSILSGVTSAGAFAAFMSTFSGLLVSLTGALAHDIYGRMLRPRSSESERLRAFRICAVLCGAISVGLGLLVESFEINKMVGWAFAIAATSYFPLLFLSSWWRGMTMKGAATGMLAGGTLSLIAVVSTMVADQALWAKPLAAFYNGHPLARTLAEQPAIWALTLAIILMIVVSKATAREVPDDIRMKMLVLHAPEGLGLKQEYIAADPTPQAKAHGEMAHPQSPRDPLKGAAAPDVAAGE
ncbi:MAG: cation acetate symporter [Verrucomicrobia bacterium]|nr:cation acetate symporter [Verrucomicrobiota bacterium]